MFLQRGQQKGFLDKRTEASIPLVLPCGFLMEIKPNVIHVGTVWLKREMDQFKGLIDSFYCETNSSHE